jgi:hypothetical protein
MSDRIVSWRINQGINEPSVSPSLSTVSSSSGLSVLSINSIVSDTYIMTAEATEAQCVDLGATKLTNLTLSANPTTDDSFVRHDTYFFKDGNITFLVCGALYCASGSLKNTVGRRHTLLCSSILFLSGLSLLLHQTWPARRP